MMNAQIERYVALHRSFGRKFEVQERLLRLFAAYARATAPAGRRVNAGRFSSMRRSSCRNSRPITT